MKVKVQSKNKAPEFLENIQDFQVYRKQIYNEATLTC
jgi:hypothetical protein